MAAHGSQPNSLVPGVMDGVGGLSCLPERTEEPREAERCLANGPVDMLRGAGGQMCQSTESTSSIRHITRKERLIEASTSKTDLQRPKRAGPETSSTSGELKLTATCALNGTRRDTHGVREVK